MFLPLFWKWKSDYNCFFPISHSRSFLFPHCCNSPCSLSPCKVLSCVPWLCPGPWGSRATDRWQHSCKAGGGKERRSAGVAVDKRVVHSRARRQWPGLGGGGGGWSEDPRRCGVCGDEGSHVTVCCYLFKSKTQWQDGGRTRWRYHGYSSLPKINDDCIDRTSDHRIGMDLHSDAASSHSFTHSEPGIDAPLLSWLSLPRSLLWVWPHPDSKQRQMR